MRICQFSPTIVPGDAMSGQAIALHRIIESAGVESLIFEGCEGSDRTAPVRAYTDYAPMPGDVVVMNYGGRGDFEDWALSRPVDTFLYYHNATPPHFFDRLQHPLSRALRYARDSLPALAHLGGLAASPYNKIEMERAGFRNVRVIPYVLDPDDFRQRAETPAAQAIVARHGDRTNWLHVGRIAPNKRIEDIIRAFYVYHHLYDNTSRLILVGTSSGLEQYYCAIRDWVGRLGLDQAVLFAGQVNDRREVAGYYRAASLYVCMSEHEGFCIPLVEAMAHDVPIIAYRSTGVAYTMGQAGILLDSKEPALVAAAAWLILNNAGHRQRIIDSQRVQAVAWRPEIARQAVLDWLADLARR